MLVIDENKRHYEYIKEYDRFMFHIYVCKSCLQCFSSKHVLTEHKDVCLSINGTQSVKIKKGTTEFKNYFQQLLLPFKVYAEFECNLESVESYEDSYTKKYQDHIPCSFADKLVCVDDKFSKLIIGFRGEDAVF